jgi:hypothetical protein
MTKIALLALPALCTAFALTAAGAQTPRIPAGPGSMGNARAAHMPSAAEMAAQHKQICQDGYAHTVGDLAYLEARLSLTAAQQISFDHWKNIKLENARRDTADCTTREMRFQSGPPTVLDDMTREQETLKRRLADLDSEIPVLNAFYNALSQAQKDALNHPGQPGMMMSRRRAFASGMAQHMDHGGAPGGPNPPPQ